MKIALDTTILVRANEHANGLARELLTCIIEGGHTLLISSEVLHELARVLRYPRLQTLYRLDETDVFNYVGFLLQSSSVVVLNPLIMAPIRDINDVIVMQTAIIGEADVLCSNDDDFFNLPASEYLTKLGIEVLDDVSLMHRLRSQHPLRQW